MDLLKQIETKQARLGVIGLGYVGPAARRRVRARRVPRRRLRRRQDQGRRAERGHELHPGRARPSTSPTPCKRGFFTATTDGARAGRRRHHRHLRADAAPQDARPRSVVRRPGRRDDRQRAAQGSADHPRIDDLSGDDRRGRAAGARGQGTEGRRGFLSRVLARARRSGQPDLPHEEHPEGGRREQRGQHSRRRSRSTAR